MKHKTLLIGWDAADWKVINELMAEGKMPTLQRMIEQGTSGNLRTLQPPLSPMLWTSIATGKRPYKHGIYGFTEPTPTDDAVQPMTNVSRSSKAIWNILNQQDKRSLVVGWWPSHPAEPIRGTMVSDFFHKSPKKPGDPWPLRANCVHPPEKLKEIAELRVHPTEMQAEDLLPFVPEGADIDQSVDGRLSSVMKVTAECSSIHAAATHLLESDPWDFAAIYYDAIDHYSHGFMRYRAPQQKHIRDDDFRLFRHVVDTGYVFHDMMLKQLLEYADEDTTVMLISDHGFHPDHLRPERLPNEPAGPAKEHRDYGIFVATGPNIRPGHVIHGANLLDITPTVLACHGLPAGEDMDGRVLEDIFIERPSLETIESWELVDGDSGEHPEGFTISAEESQAALEQLVALGYIDPVQDDSKVEVVKCARELEYNLSRAYMDADLHGEATPRLLKLYQDHPLEFRYGIQLAACLRMLNDNLSLQSMLGDLADRMKRYSELARSRIAEFDEATEDRQQLWNALKEHDDENTDPEAVKLARVDRDGKPILFAEGEQALLRKLRGVARGNPSSLNFLASTAAAGNGDFEGSLELLERTRRTHQGTCEFHTHRGNILISLDRLEEAEASLLEGISIDESNPKCLMGLSRCYVEMGRHAQALQTAEEAIDLQHQFPLAHYYLGRAHQGMGDFESAVAAFKTALGQNPNFEEAHDALAEIHEGAMPDEPLAAEHRAAARELAAGNRQEGDEATAIAFESKTIEELAEHLPSIHDADSNPDLEPTLDHPLVRVRDMKEKATQKRAQVVVVSGLPRSGTSMMMQMLAAGGLTIFSDGERVPDENNPKGYYEVDLAKGLAKKNRWVHDCDGQVVKVVAPLIRYLPQSVDYKVIFMQRPIEEIVRSQSRMLGRLGKETSDLADEQMAAIMRNDAHAAGSLLSIHKHAVLPLQYADVIADPRAATAAIAGFLGLDLDEPAMAQAVDPSLHRERQPPTAEAERP